MKLKLYRQSGQLIDESSKQQYDEAFKAFYDKADKRARELHDENIYAPAYALTMQRFLRYGERQLFKQFNQDIEVELPNTAAKWTKLLADYGDTPLMVAKAQGSGKLLLVIMDTLA